MPAARGKLAVTQAESAETTAQMLELRKKGWTYRAIGEKYGMSAPSAYERVKKALYNTVAEPAEDLRQMELERLDDLYTKLSAKIEAGDVRAISTALSIMDRRAKMLGIDAPMKVESSVTLNETSKIDQAVADLVALMRDADDRSPADR